jgi:hypothetical protein
VLGISNLQLVFNCWRSQDDSKEKVISPMLIGAADLRSSIMTLKEQCIHTKRKPNQAISGLSQQASNNRRPGPPSD